MTHRKFRRLKASLGSAIVARGVLELLWDPCYESGDDYLGTADDIEDLVGWAGERGALTKALVDAGAPEGFGFIEPVAEGATTYRVHDLWHHAPDYVSNRRTREDERRIDKVCKRCARPYSSADPRSEYCSGACRTGGWRDRRSVVTDRDGHETLASVTVTDRDGSPAPAPALAPAPLLLTSPTPSAAALVDLWNQSVTAPIPQVTKLTAGRISKYNARLKAFPDLALWRSVISWVNGQDWCRASGTGDHPNWTATLDWLCKSDDQVQRYIERATQNQLRSRPRVAGCRHSPPCADAVACTAKRDAERKAIPA